ncbi:hypothetical protein ACFL0K_01325 [Patescibacteria group bacterium]
MFTFTIGILFFLTNIEQGSADSFILIPKESKGVIVDKKALDPNWIHVSTEDKVRNYFEDTPVLAEIAWCESKFKHYDKNGKAIRGEVTSEDIGVMQINEYFHGKTVGILDINIHTLEGNLEYAQWLYDREGTTPWNSSKHCWGDYKAIAMK